MHKIKKYMYKHTATLQHNERLLKENQETGEVNYIPHIIPANIPDGKSKLDYQEFGMLNIKASKVLEKHLSNLELSIVFKMISKCEFNTNSLKPLNNETSIRILAEEFNLSVNTVPKVLKRLYDLGVYMQLQIVENSQENSYWVLNPYIFWRGRLKNDSLFITFSNTDLGRLLN